MNLQSYFLPFSVAWVSEWVKSLSWVWLFATQWTVAHQAPPSMGFSRHFCSLLLHFTNAKNLYKAVHRELPHLPLHGLTFSIFWSLPTIPLPHFARPWAKCEVEESLKTSFEAIELCGWTHALEPILVVH